MEMIKTYGSVCSGIEAASFVLEPLGLTPLWLSEIAEFPKSFLSEKYPHIPNIGDMNDIAKKIESGEVDAPDLLCGGTPCQAFSLAGWRAGTDDARGQLTLKYIDILNAIDERRKADGLGRASFFWENVEGVLTDKTNAFGCFIAGLAGLDTPIAMPTKKCPAGVLYGKTRNIAWRVLDAKYFGLPQQRRRIYVLGGGKDFHPEKILFEKGEYLADPFKFGKENGIPSLFEETDRRKEKIRAITTELTKVIDGQEIEIFRSYSDCLYSAYGTKWNGNAAAFNGSLFVSQNGRLRRLTPLECDRLMGFPDNYTNIPQCRDTQRYQASGNSWAVPVIEWIAQRLINTNLPEIKPQNPLVSTDEYTLYLLNDFSQEAESGYINATIYPYDYHITSLMDIIDTHSPEKFYISPAGCAGILRRKYEHNAGMNSRLEVVLQNCSRA